MTPQEKKHALEIFETIADLGETERVDYLDEVCAGDPELRREVEELVAADQKTQGEFLGPGDLRGAVAGLTDLSLVGRRVGAYQVLRELGRGGMGSVYLAERSDEEFERQVAVKVVQGAFGARDDIVRRFRSERQILARLDHPHVARLLDGGTTEDGVPYFVMDYIEGVPIDVYCDQRRLGVADRLRLFLDVASAVSYAHQNLIVHRDVKPSNVLVTADGTVKLLDFGIAKVLKGGDGGVPSVATATAAVMTPAYASPEQILGEPITTATDVYSLGVLLYELLTGDLPHRFERRSLAEVVRVISEEVPAPPSVAARRIEEAAHKRRSSPQKLCRRLRGDLDTIVLRALDKEPGRRYPSVDQLASDLRRHLGGQPVTARRDTLGYRAGKFVRRHRGGVAAAALVVLALLGGIATTAWQARVAAGQARIAEAERDHARSEAEKAERVVGFLNGMLTSADPNRGGREVTVAEILDDAAQRLGKDLADEPEVAASARLALATTYRSLGLYDEAETEAREALRLRRQLGGQTGPETAAVLCELGHLLNDMGRYEEGERHLREGALAFQGDAVRYADCRVQLAVGLNNQGRDEEAEAVYREVLPIYRRELDPADVRIGTVLNNLAVVLGNRGDFAAAEPLHREALHIMRAAYGDEHPEVAYTLYNLGGVLDAQGDYAAAEPLYREALALRLKLLGENHPYVLLTRASLANLLWARKDFAAAEPLAREALAGGAATLDADHPLMAYAHIVLGQVLCDAGKPAEGEAHLRSALEIRRKVFPPGHWLLANTESSLGACLTVLGRYEEAEELLQKSYQQLRSDRGEDHEKTVLTRERLEHLHEIWRKPKG